MRFSAGVIGGPDLEWFRTLSAWRYRSVNPCLLPEAAAPCEVIRDALRGWRFKRISVDPSDTKKIRRLVEQGVKSADKGKYLPAEQVFDRLEAKYRALAEAKKTKPRRR